MKQKISLDIHSKGKLNDFIYSQIEEFNTGRIVIDNYGFATCLIMYGLGAGEMPDILWNENYTVLNVSENGKQTVTLTFKELSELQPDLNPENDLANITYPEGQNISAW